MDILSTNKMNSNCDIQICVESKIIATSGRYKFNYMKVVNMYRGESMRRHGARFFGSCSGLIFSILVLIFYFLSTF